MEIPNESLSFSTFSINIVAHPGGRKLSCAGPIAQMPAARYRITHCQRNG
jgi:hypothetical protein